MLSSVAVEEHPAKMQPQLPLKQVDTSGSDASSTKDKLERYRQLLLKEEEIRAKLEKAVKVDEKGEVCLPRVLMQRNYLSDSVLHPRRKMSCPAMNLPLRQMASPGVERRTSAVPDIRVQPVSSPVLRSPKLDIRGQKFDFVTGTDKMEEDPLKRKISCPTKMPMRRSSSIDDLSCHTRLAKSSTRRLSMQPSYAEIRALQARERLEKRRASLKSLEEDFVKAQSMIQMARTLSLTCLAESQTEEEMDDKEERKRKTSSCVL